ncbi:hypothetical protein ACLMJK_008535 [Lecanora helva]
MRLQLTIQRQSLPAVQILWTVAPTRPPLAAAGSSITVSQFLEQINDIIPLESGEWGLEDYAVEVRGFECLHFSELGQILRDDDEVCIRPLQTSDLRVRKISGRHQISADGKHLIDGVAFGRPYLRRADRPAVRIPPRKRRRITYRDDEENVYEEDINDQQVVLRASFNDVSDDQDEDSALEQEFNAELGAELKDLQHDLQAGAKENGHARINEEVQKPLRRSRRQSQRSPHGLGLLQLLDENGQPFAGEYNNPLLDQFGSIEPDTAIKVDKTRNRRPLNYVQGSSKSAKHGVQDSSASPDLPARRNSAGSNRSVHFEDIEPATPVTVRESLNSDDDDEDDDYNADEIDESDKENAEPPAHGADFIVDSSSSSDSSSMTSSDDLGSDETSSSGLSSSDSSSESDVEPEQLSLKGSGKESDGEETSSTSSSGSSDSELESTKRGQSKSQTASTTIQKSDQQIESVKASIPKTTTVSSGQGMKKTVARNQRRREQKHLAFLKREGTLPAEATIRDLREYQQGQQDNVADFESVNKRPKTHSPQLDDAINAKRQALLASIATGGIDISHATDLADLDREDIRSRDQESSQIEEGFETAQQRAQEPDDEIEEPKKDANLEGTPVASSASKPTEISGKQLSPPSQSRRTKLDISSAKRMLFGSLGLRTPKTKEDEQRTREALMNDVRPIKEPQAEAAAESLEDIAADDSWKDKIDLRAVECCHDGIKLSTPPFPFVQRWDPQQQRGYRSQHSQKRKSKKRKRNNSSYYNESYENSQSKNIDCEENVHGNDDWGFQGEKPLNYDEDSNIENAVNDQLLRETGGSSAENFCEAPEQITKQLLPEDLTTCPTLTRETAHEGTVIAFKQLEMSAETNWQPRISEYRTATIDQVKSDGNLQMTPAERDCPNKQVEYDSRTGERLYAKFEMPGYNDEDSDDKLEISFDELISPVLLLAAQKDVGISEDHGKRDEELGTEEALKASPKPIDRAGNDYINAQKTSSDEIEEPSKEAREDISELIRDAGWRSSVQSELNKGLISPRAPNQKECNIEHDDTTLIEAPSPKPNSFSSSPVVHVRSSPPVTKSPCPKSVLASGVEIAESIPPQDFDDNKSAHSDSKHTVEYPSLPQLDGDSELVQEDAQQRSDPTIDQQTLSEDLPSDNTEHLKSASARSSPRSSQENIPSIAPPPDAHLTESEDEFPAPFSQAWNTRMSQEIEIKSESSKENAISPPSYRRSKANGNRASSQRESKQLRRPNYGSSIHEENDEKDTPRASQRKSSQFVDLTISSDSVDLDYNDEDDSFRLPKGPGWVKKTRASKEWSAPLQSSQGKAKTKSK